ncbi:MAG TPA: hypothetical protein VND91_00305 [Candidatus Saccharimonadia bacterium]|nr:hypothetical protein [Candidatus Saccharimonadia bacterium]
MHASYLLTTYLPRGAVPRIEAACAATGAQTRWLAQPAVAAPLLASETLELVKDAIVFSVTAHSDARLGLSLDVNGREARRSELASDHVDLETIELWLQAFEAFAHEDARPLAG